MRRPERQAAHHGDQATTLAFGDKPPVGYDYIPEGPSHLQSYLAVRNSHHDYTYDIESRILIPVPLSEAQINAPARVYFIKGEAAFRPLARLLDAGRRTELRARLQRFEQEMAV